jgi:glycosyltransferase involved in cell wall biosynthesis
MTTPYLSVCIPTYEMAGLGVPFLKESFDILTAQTFKDFEVVISDNSKTNDIKKLCESYKDKLTINYFVNTEPVKNMPVNTNNAIKHAQGKIIKILMQDDFLFDNRSLEHIVKNFDVTNDHWLATGSEHSKDGKTFFRPFFPAWSHNMHKGHNTIGSPSVISIKNENPLFFDPKLQFYVDVDFYQRYYDLYGQPKLVKDIAVVNRIGEHQASSYLSERFKLNEYRYMLRKYNVPNGTFLYYKRLIIITLVRIKKTLKLLLRS